LIDVVEQLGNEAHVGKDGHEIRVALPARNDVGVEMIGDSSAGTSAEVHSDVEPVGAEDLLKQFVCAFDEGHHVVEDGRGKLLEISLMLGGSNKEVSAGIRKSVEEGEGVLGSPEDKVFSIFGGVFPVLTDEAFGVLGNVVEGFDIFHSPGGPEVFVEFGHCADCLTYGWASFRR